VRVEDALRLEDPADLFQERVQSDDMLHCRHRKRRVKGLIGKGEITTIRTHKSNSDTISGGIGRPGKACGWVHSDDFATGLARQVSRCLSRNVTTDLQDSARIRGQGTDDDVRSLFLIGHHH